MSGKQMEGDNQRRRALAREARERGRRPSGTGATLGSSKQPEHLDSGRRAGPPPAGGRKPRAGHAGPRPATPPTPGPSWPLPGPAPIAGGTPGTTVIDYRDLVTDVGRRVGTGFDEARTAAEATVVALARALAEADRERLLDAVPAELYGERSAAVSRSDDLAGFLAEVARLGRSTPEQARLRAQATLNALAEQDRDLVESLDVPIDLRELLDPPPTGGGLVNPTGGTPALTGAELRSALAGLPYWSAEGRGLARTIALPPDNLDRVLDRVARLRPETGRGPSVGRDPDGTAVIVVRTGRADGVTALDVALAHAVDEVVENAAAGMAG